MSETNKCQCNCGHGGETIPEPKVASAPAHPHADVSMNHAHDSRHGGKAHNDDEFNHASPSVDDDRPGMNGAMPSTHLAEELD